MTVSFGNINELVGTVAPIPTAKKKNIVYGPAPKHLVKAVRDELRRLIELPDLDANLGTIARFAHQADDMLMCVKAPEAVMRDEHNVMVPGILQGAPNAETYGATILRQLLPAIQNFNKQESPSMLVDAIANARRLGMTDVAAELEKKLTGGKALDGERPIDDPIAKLRAAPKRKKKATT